MKVRKRERTTLPDQVSYQKSFDFAGMTVLGVSLLLGSLRHDS